jgi:hypothetical protein
MGGSACDDDDDDDEGAAAAAAAADFTAEVVGKWTLGPSGKNAFAGAGGLTVELDDDAEDAMTAAGTRIVREIGMGESAVGTAERLKKQSVSKKLRRSAQLTAETSVTDSPPGVALYAISFETLCTDTTTVVNTPTTLITW